MNVERNSGAGRHQRVVRLRAGDWKSVPLLLARSRRRRRIGLRPAAGPHGILLRGASVHGFGMKMPLEVVALDRRGKVVRSCVLRPVRVLWIPGAWWIAEMPVSAGNPPPGTQVVVDSLGVCRAL